MLTFLILRLTDSMVEQLMEVSELIFFESQIKGLLDATFERQLKS